MSGTGKRKSPDEADVMPSTARHRKKHKVAAARTIAVQPQQTSHAIAGIPREPASAKDSMRGLPGSLDVEKFTEARAFEINAMEEAIDSAKGASTHRAWQELPRHLRRRAASHNVRRVPLRLREKARAEMDPVKKKALKRTLPKRGKSKTLTRTEDFLKRQRDKVWLESHLWHSKRMHMEQRWGYSLAVTPTEKSYRPSHRAAARGVILNDVSYIGTIEVQGPQALLVSVLQRVVDPQGHGPGARQYINGSRMLSTYAFGDSAYPYQALGPVSVLWKPYILEDDKPDPPAPGEVKRGGAANARRRIANAENKARKAVETSKTTQALGRGKAKADAPARLPEASETSVRVCWLRAHPASFDMLFDAIRQAASRVLEARKAEGKEKEQVQIADLREKVLAFELMGPKSTQVLRGALDPVRTEERAEFRQFWNSLHSVQSSESAPRGMVVGFQVMDPRLRFPPKMAKVDPPVARQGFPSLDTPSVPFPTSVVAQSLLWDEGTREGLAKPKFTKRDLDSRRAENLIPGTALKATSQDARVPVILIQHSIESSSSSSSLSAKTPGIHGWTLLVPNGWGMPFLSSLLFTGARVGGLRERAVQAFESGIPSFPADAVDSDAYADEVERSAEEQQTRWMRTPPAKRINYEERGINDPWRPDWRGLLGLDPIAEEDEEEFVAAQREPLSTMTGQIDDGMDVDPRVALQNVDQSLYPWVLRGPDASAIISAVNARLHPSSELLSQLDHLRQKRGLGQLGVPESDLWRSALVHVRYEMCGRGRPTEGAMAFVVKDDEAKAWIRVHASRSSFSMDGLETVDETQLSEVEPSLNDLAGYVTSGNFSLSIGFAHAIGAMSLSAYHDLLQQMHRLEGSKARSPLVKIRDRDGVVCRAARVHLM